MISSVSIPVSSEIKLEAILNLPKKNCPFVIIMSGYNGPSSSGKNSSAAIELEKKLAEIEIGSIRFDYRGIGSSSKCTRVNITSTLKDLQAVCKYVRKLSVNLEKIGLTGSSYSGGIAVHAASISEFFKVLVVASGVMNWSSVNKQLEDIKAPDFYEDAKKYYFYAAASSVKCPTLIIHKTEDALVPVEQGKKLFKKLQCKKKLELIKGKGHRYEGEEFEKRTALSVTWIESCLK